MIRNEWINNSFNEISYENMVLQHILNDGSCHISLSDVDRNFLIGSTAGSAGTNYSQKIDLSGVLSTTGKQDWEKVLEKHKW